MSIDRRRPCRLWKSGGRSAAFFTARETADVSDAHSTRGAACWCGRRDLAAYSPDYRVCHGCGALVSRAGLTTDEIVVREDEHDYYGKGYWLGHQTAELGLPPIDQRARADLSDRCMHWLRELLRYKRPPARMLEIGCAHGGFVALARWAGYDAVGLEMSPWVVEFARRTFGIPVLQGPVEQQPLPERSFDAVVLNDVLEHLADPAGTLGCCARLLKDDGVLFVQTPCYPEGASFEELQARKDRFLEMMQGMAREHIHLFSRRAAGVLLSRLGFAAVEFLPARFEYDMYLVAGRRAVHRSDLAPLAAELTGSPEGRMKLAWFDLLTEFEARLADSANRLDQILRLHDMLRQSEAARERLQAQVDGLAARPRGWLRSVRRLLRAG